MIKLIADIGSNHNQDLDRAFRMIDELVVLGVDGVKFQLFKADKLYKDKKLQKELKKAEMPIEWIPRLQSYCTRKKIMFGCTPFDVESAKELHGKVDFYKISSFDFFRKDLITWCMVDKKPLMISLGLTKDLNGGTFFTATEIMEREITLMHCVSKYPTRPYESSISRIREMNEKYGKYFTIGYSDHTADPIVAAFAICAGAKTIEFHYDLEDKEGLESRHGHCWNKTLLLRLNNLINGYGLLQQFTLTEEQKKLLADPETGLRQ